MIAAAVKFALDYFKADPKKAARIVAEALGWLTVAAAIIDKAIDILKQVFTAIPQ